MASEADTIRHWIRRKLPIELRDGAIDCCASMAVRRRPRGRCCNRPSPSCRSLSPAIHIGRCSIRNPASCRRRTASPTGVTWKTPALPRCSPIPTSTASSPSSIRPCRCSRGPMASWTGMAGSSPARPSSSTTAFRRCSAISPMERESRETRAMCPTTRPPPGAMRCSPTTRSSTRPPSPPCCRDYGRRAAAKAMPSPRSSASG